jgi:bifunctional polynucleotide phosphatase/kinase
VASFFKPASQKEAEKLVWKISNKSLIVGKYAADAQTIHANLGPAPRRQRIAAFDLDDTLISPSTGSKWVRSASEWRWWHPTVPTKLKSLHSDGFRIVLFSNQGAVSLKNDAKALQKDSVSLVNFKNQLGAILRQLDLPVHVYAAMGKDVYRKPRTGMWKVMLEEHGMGGDNAVDLASSFYVGDAAGRERATKRPKDHACSDR